MGDLGATMNSDTHATSGGGDQTLQVLADCLDRFVAAWDAGDGPPVLRDYLPAATAQRRSVLTELAKIDLEYRWQHRNLPKRLGEYLEEFPELTEGGVPPDLVYEEFHIRRQCGFAVEPQEYLEQFPEQADELERLLGLDDGQSMAVLNVRAKQTLDRIDAGQQLDDFDLLTRLGRGAFAVVFLARQRSMQRLVALKISLDSGSEPQTLAQLDHDYIVRVFDQRIDAERKLRMLYMQYVAGGTLHTIVAAVRQTPPHARSGELLTRTISRVLEDRGESRDTESSLTRKLQSLSWPEVVCWIGVRLAEALHYAHQRGVLHRDVKPANVLMTPEGVPKLADFNISFSSRTAGATPAAYFGGSLAYMSPEQLEACDPAHQRDAESLDGRSDLFSLSVVLWELLTGQRPFSGDDVQESWSRTLQCLVAQRRAGVDADRAVPAGVAFPAGLRRVLLRALDPDPQGRWSSGAELAQQLELCGNPRAEQIIYPEAGSWRRRLRPGSIAIVVLLAALPNIFAGLFNYFYNRTHIIESLHDVHNARDAFWMIQTVINSIAYPTGLGLLAYLTWTVQRARREIDDVARYAWLRRRSLLLGHCAAGIGVVEWAIAGLAYPFSMHLAVGAVPLEVYLHFAGSLLLCGLIAAAYPFFGVTFFSVHVLYPALLRPGLARANDEPPLTQVRMLAWRYLAVAMSVPMLGVAALVAMDQDARLALGVLSTGAFLGSLMMFWLFRRLQSDLDALRAVSPGR